MSEKALWKAVRTGMKGRWHATRHEDKLTLGIPDVSYGMNGVAGWIELKFVSKPPARGGAVAVPHFSKEQRRWMLSRYASMETAASFV